MLIIGRIHRHRSSCYVLGIYTVIAGYFPLKSAICPWTLPQCLDFLFDSQHSRKCSCGGTYRLRLEKKQYQCSKCRFAVSPTAGTIFHKSTTPLSDWFIALYLFSQAKTGLTAKELERQLGCTYKTAWRMLTLIRSSLHPKGKKLSGTVETDEAYFGGRNKRSEGDTKTKVMGAVERKGNMIQRVVPNMKRGITKQFVSQTVKKGSDLYTDGSKRYSGVTYGYNHKKVNHAKKEYVKGDVHINNMEVFWSNVKRSLKGTHKVISSEYLQSYLDGFVFHCNNRNNDRKRFFSLLGSVLLGGAEI